MNIQTELDRLYLEYLERVFQDKAFHKLVEDNEVSSPQFVDVETPRGNYLNSKNRILIVGKETHYWFSPEEREKEGLSVIDLQYSRYIEALKRTYNKHNLGKGSNHEKSYPSPIFLFIDLMIKELNKKGSYGLLLTELLRHDWKGTKLPDNLIPIVTFDNNYILRKEIELLQPDALIFLTGPSYDPYISAAYPMAEFKPLDGYSPNEISTITNIPKIKKAVRTYHPSYHNRISGQYKFELAEQFVVFSHLSPA